MFFNDIFKRMTKLNYPKPRYDIIFHLSPILKPVDDGIRSEQQFDEAWRKEADIMIKSTMIIFKPTHLYILEQKDLNTRTNFCIEKIKKHLKEKHE
jgi:nicotinamide riboside kinase